MPRSNPSPSYVSAQAELCIAFDTKLYALIANEDKLFGQSLICRSAQPRDLLATKFLSMAIDMAPVQAGRQSGLHVMHRHLRDNISVKILQTAQMATQGEHIAIYPDLSVIFFITDPQDKAMVYALPTPLIVRKEVLPLDAFGNIASEVLNTDDDIEPYFTGAEIGLSADALLWWQQFSAEVPILVRRLNSLPVMQLDVPPCDIREFGYCNPDMGKMPAGRMTEASAAFLMRRTKGDDCEHMGHIAFDPLDDVLQTVTTIFEISMDIALNDFQRESDLGQISSRLCAKSPNNERASASIDLAPGLEIGNITERILSLVGPDWLKATNEFQGLPMEASGRLALNGSLVLTHHYSTPGSLSAHHTMKKHDELEILKRRLKNEVRCEK